MVDPDLGKKPMETPQTPPPPRRRGRVLISLRVAWLVLVTLIVACSVIPLIVIYDKLANAAIRRLAGHLIDGLTHTVELQTRLHLNSPVENVRDLSILMTEYNTPLDPDHPSPTNIHPAGSPVTDPETYFPFMQAVMKAADWRLLYLYFGTPQFTWVGISQALPADVIMALQLPNDEAVLANLYRLSFTRPAPPDKSSVGFLRKSWVKRRDTNVMVGINDLPSDFNSTNRPWYIAAQNGGPHDLFWSQYFLVGVNTMGITLATPVFDGLGSFIAVAAADFSLKQLQELVTLTQTTYGTPGSLVFIVDTCDESLIVSSVDVDDPAQLTWLNSSIPTLLGQLGRKACESPPEIDYNLRSTMVSIHGQAFLFGTLRINTSGVGLNWNVGVLLPSEDILGRVMYARRWSIIAAVLVGVSLCALSMGAALLLTRTMRRVTSIMKRKCRMNLMQFDDTMLSEADVARSLKEQMDTACEEMQNLSMWPFPLLEVHRLSVGFVEMVRGLQNMMERMQSLSRDRVAERQILINMSRDVRNPLHGMLGITELLLDDTQLTQEQVGYLRTFRTALEYLRHILSDIIDLSKLQTGRLTLTLDNCDVGSVLFQVAELYGIVASERNITLRVDDGLSKYQSQELPGKQQATQLGLYEAIADFHRLQQIVTNLVSNATKFSDVNGTVHMVAMFASKAQVMSTPFLGQHVPTGSLNPIVAFSTTDTSPLTDDDFVVIAIIDNGRGIPSDCIAKVFDLFFQVKPEDSQEGSGGMGLTICRDIVLMMNGAIGVSTALDCGSVFWVALPKASPVNKHPAGRNSSASCMLRTSISASKKKAKPVLVVDEMAVNRIVLQSALTGDGYRVEQASTVTQALELINNGMVPGIIFLDFHRSADVLMRGLRANLKEVSSIRVVCFVTDSADAARAKAIGADEVLYKPFNRKALLQAVKAHYCLPCGSTQLDSDEDATFHRKESSGSLSTQPGILTARSTLVEARSPADLRDVSMNGLMTASAFRSVDSALGDSLEGARRPSDAVTGSLPSRAASRQSNEQSPRATSRRNHSSTPPLTAFGSTGIRATSMDEHEHASTSMEIVTPTPTTTTTTTTTSTPVKTTSRFQRTAVVVGKGTFGKVYKGIDNHNGSAVALKVMTISAAGEQSFARELSIFRDLKHDCIVKFVDCEVREDSCIVAMELMGGGSLAQLCRPNGLPEAVIRRYLHSILRGMKYLHDMDIIHRDIKPANILLDSQGKAKVSDFGLARLNQELQGGSATFCGSCPYMSPEVITSNLYSPASDVWGLGMVTIELFSGALPWSHLSQAETQFKLMQAVIEAAARVTASLNNHESPVAELHPIPEGISAEAKDFIRQCLQLEPSDRPSCGSLLRHVFVSSPAPQSRTRNPSVPLLKIGSASADNYSRAFGYLSD